MECLPKTMSLSPKKMPKGKLKLLHWGITTIKTEEPLDNINKVINFYFSEVKRKTQDNYQNTTICMILLQTWTLMSSLTIYTERIYVTSFQYHVFILFTGVMAILLVLGRHEPHDLKANLSFEVSKKGAQAELSPFLTVTPNSTEYHSNLFRLPTQKHHKTIV